jgi:hypothetical protein
MALDSHSTGLHSSLHERRDGLIVSEPEYKPWKLREFMADLDGNLIRVFYDFSRDV